MQNALKLIASRSASAMSEALDCIKAIRAKSPIIQRRYEHVAEIALGDASANWTQAERELIVSHLATSDEAGTKSRAVRLSDDDWALAREIGDGNAAAGIRLALRGFRQ